jgi:hypothetical protein
VWGGGEPLRAGEERKSQMGQQLRKSPQSWLTAQRRTQKLGTSDKNGKKPHPHFHRCFSSHILKAGLKFLLPLRNDNISNLMSLE